MNIDDALRRLAQRYPGDSPARQPVHTVYGGAHLFKSDTAVKLGALALTALQEFGGDPDEFARAIGIPGRLAHRVHQRVRSKTSGSTSRTATAIALMPKRMDTPRGRRARSRSG